MSLRRSKTASEPPKTVDFKEGIEIPGVTPTMVSVMQKLDSMDTQLRSESRIEALTRDLEALKQSNEALGKQLKEQMRFSTELASTSKVKQDVHEKLGVLEAHARVQSLKRGVNDKLLRMEGRFEAEEDEEDHTSSQTDEWMQERARIHQIQSRLKRLGE
jgi:hypothetical protein